MVYIVSILHSVKYSLHDAWHPGQYYIKGHILYVGESPRLCGADCIEMPDENRTIYNEQ